MAVRAKFKCYGSDPQTGLVTFQAVTGEGNETWSKWTPSGQIQMSITNSEALKQFEVGKDYLVTFRLE